MMKAGLCSVSFRKLSPRMICQAAADAGLSCIEWGSDVHMPIKNPQRLQEIVQLQQEFGISCCSYGTYFYLGSTPIEELSDYIRVAKILGTNILRLWCGKKNRESTTEEEKAILFDHCRRAAKKAEEENVILCLECHRNTYTETKEGALELMEYVNSKHFRMYWQPSSIHTIEENLRYARPLSPYTYHLHVQYHEDGKLQPLEAGIQIWQKYMKEFPGEHCVLLEFMPDHQVSSLPAQAKALYEIIEAAR